MTTATKQRTGLASWKKLLTEAEQLRGQAGISAHRRALILTQLYDDVDFRAERGLADDDAVEDVLGELVNDLCLNFAELRAMLHEFPESEAWSDGKLATLYDKAAERIRSRRSAIERDPITRRRVTSKEYDRLAGEKQDVESRLRYVEGQHTESLTEIQRLRIENAELRGRVSQLETMLAKKN
jgi:hypothetical protein